MLVLAPSQLREAAWNGFASPGMPLAGWLALVGLPPLAAAAYAFRDRDHSGPLHTFVFAVAALAAVSIGAALVFADEAPCSAAQFHELHLTCEISSPL